MEIDLHKRTHRGGGDGGGAVITYINDIRPATEFKTFTFSKFKRTEVKRELQTCIYNKKPQQACYWAAEMVCSGHYADLWEIILSFFGKYIHLGNPKLPIYLEMRYQAFRAILDDGGFINELQARNSPEIRRLFTEIICVLCFSNRKTAVEAVRIDREEEFDIENITEKLAAPSQTYIEDIFRRQDPMECIIPTNEFAFSIVSRDTAMACYWLEWMIEFDTVCKKRKEPCSADRRFHIPVARKYQEDAIWIFWDVFLYYAEQRGGGGATRRIMDALLTLFCIHYTPGCSKRRRYILYFGISLLTEMVDFRATEMISQKKMVERIVASIDNVYQLIKENEDSSMDYLYTNLQKEVEMEKSIRHMEFMMGAAVGDTVPHAAAAAAATLPFHG